jgi:hypothetical protein
MRFKDFYNLNESIYANVSKLKKLFNLALDGGNLDDYLRVDKYAPEELILISPMILDEITEEEVKKICDSAGFYCSIHHNDKGKPLPFDPIYITPKNQKEPLKLGNQEYYHCSLATNLDKSGIRLKSRKVDNDYDVYEDRIYLAPVALFGNPQELIDMVASEHNCDKSEICVYKVTLPKGYEVYQDPTKREAVYVTNAIPPKYITKINL